MDVRLILERLLKDKETEIKEFKEAKNSFDFGILGKYFSALSNEANLKGVADAWLVFGVTNKRNVIGTTFRNSKEKLDSLKKEIADKTTNRITFEAVYEIQYLGKRVILFQIPAAPRGFPVAFDGHYYGREGESLSPLNLQEIEKIRATHSYDWSAEIVNDASLTDLDPEAILKARVNFRKKFPEHDLEIDGWDDKTFLNKAKVFIKGKVTRTALLLLGKSESDVFLNPSVARIRWNLKYRYIPEATLFPEEVQRYEPFVIREALNNCIAHQDYLKGGMINVIELGDDQLIFSNYGDFIPKSVEKVVIENSPEEFYRNRFLVTAMFNLNMVDTIGSGIRKMFDDDYYKKLILDCVLEYKSATKKDLDELLLGKFSELLSLKQKKNKLSNLLGDLRRAGVICNKGTTSKPVYVALKVKR